MTALYSAVLFCRLEKMCQLIRSTLFLSMAVFIASSTLVMADEPTTVLAVVNGTEITTAQIEGLSGINADIDFAALSDEQKSQILVSLINRQLVVEQAKKEGFDQSEQIANAVQAMTETYISQQYLIKVAAGTDLGEEVLVAYYEDNFQGQPEQYEVAHILLASEEEVNAVLELLGKGADFSKLAEMKSKDRVSAEKGGDLGWFTSGDMMPSFYKTVSELNRGEISTHATKTQFGWHIVRLSDKRESIPQPFNQVRQGIRQVLVEKKMADYLDGLRDGANIEIR